MPCHAQVAAEPHVPADAAVYMAGVRENIMLGGDNAGRGQWVGALLAAGGGGGGGTQGGGGGGLSQVVPVSWRQQVTRRTEMEGLAARLIAKRHDGH
jgi:hypothetical protein